LLTSKKSVILLFSKYTAVIILFALIQYIFGISSTFAGLDISSIGHGIALEYFFVILTELSKIILTVSIVTFPVFLALKAAIKRLKPAGQKPEKFIWLGIALSYFFFLFASALNYPAMYESTSANWINKLLFSLSFYLSPTGIGLCGAAILFLTIFHKANFLFNRPTKRVLFASTFSVVAALGFYALQINFILPTFNFGGTNVEGKPKKPNVILIGVDSLRYDSSKNSLIAPNIAKLIEDKQSVFFKDHHVGIPRTFPSWIEMIQGKYAAKTGIRHMFPSLKDLREENSSLITHLNKDGYVSSVISDFAGDIFPRFNSGFQIVKTPDMNIETLIRQNVDLLFPAFLPLILSDFFSPIFPELKGNPAFANAMSVTRAAKKIIQDQSRQPFFLTLFYSTAHFPYAAPWPFYSKYSDTKYEGPYFFQKNPELKSKTDSVNNEDIKQIRALYAGSVNSIDSALEELFQFLKKQDLWKNTIIVLTADHGEDLFENLNYQGHGEHLFGTKVLKVPLILKLSEQSSPENPTVAALSRSIDIAPTILDLVGIDQDTMDGESLKPLFTKNGNTVKAIRTSYSETGIWFSKNGNTFFQKNRLYYPGISQILSFDPGKTGQIVLNGKFEKTIQMAKHRSLIAGDHKIIYIPKKDGVIYQLFDRRKDSDNVNNIAQSNPEILNKMKKLLHREIFAIEKNVKIVDGYVVPK